MRPWAYIEHVYGTEGTGKLASTNPRDHPPLNSKLLSVPQMLRRLLLVEETQELRKMPFPGREGREKVHLRHMRHTRS